MRPKLRRLDDWARAAPEQQVLCGVPSVQWSEPSQGVQGRMTGETGTGPCAAEAY